MTITPERKGLPGTLMRALVLLGISVFINYIDRGNLSIAAPLLKDELSITPERLGVLLSAFFWTYACLQPVYGWLVDRLNVYWLLAGGFCLWSVATAATGFGQTQCVLFFLLSMIFFGACASNIFAVSQTLAGPQAAGRWVGFQNGFGNLTGVVVPVVTGFVLGRTGNFYAAFAMVTIMTLIGSASIFFIVGRVERVSWGARAVPEIARVATAD